MDLSLTEDQELIKGSVEKFIIETYDSESRRKTIKSNLGSDDVIWKQFAELGWLGLPFAEKDGGFGGDFMDLHILMESFGKGLGSSLTQFGNQLKKGGDKVISNVKTKKPLFSGTALGSKKKTSTKISHYIKLP